MSFLRLALLLPGVLGPAAAIALLFATWFEAGDTFVALHGDRHGVLLEGSALDGSSTYAMAIVVLALVTAGATLYCVRGTFVAWAVGTAAAIAGALAALILRMTPPEPPRDTFVTGDQAYDPTAVPIVVMGCLLAAAAGLTGWAMMTRGRTTA